MLTRLEVDGFKNLLGFVAEFGPFTCIAGANAVGKSNLFDAIEFLSLLAEHPLDEAAARVRTSGGGRGLGRDLFWTDGERRAESISIAAEMIVDNLVIDDLGQPEYPAGTTLRYEVKLGYENGASAHRMVLLEERLGVLAAPSASDLIHFPHSESFAKVNGIGRSDNPTSIIDTKQSLVPGGNRSFDPKAARRTVLSSYATIEQPTILAAREELRAWRRLALDPVALGEPDPFGSPSIMDPNGRHLPTMLDRITRPALSEGDTEDEQWRESVYARITARLGSLASIRKIWIEEDEAGGRRWIRAELNNGEVVHARALSDGTLRFFALIVAWLDGSHRLLCIEEPENGLHPFQMDELVALLRDLTTDASGEFEPEEHGSPPLRQVIVNTHSPLLVQTVHAISPADILLANTEKVLRAEQSWASAVRLDPLQGTWRCHDGIRGIGKLWLAPYLGRKPMGENEP